MAFSRKVIKIVAFFKSTKRMTSGDRFDMALEAVIKWWPVYRQKQAVMIFQEHSGCHSCLTTFTLMPRARIIKEESLGVGCNWAKGPFHVINWGLSRTTLIDCLPQTVWENSCFDKFKWRSETRNIFSEPSAPTSTNKKKWKDTIKEKHKSTTSDCTNSLDPYVWHYRYCRKLQKVTSR